MKTLDWDLIRARAPGRRDFSLRVSHGGRKDEAPRKGSGAGKDKIKKLTKEEREDRWTKHTR